MERYPDLDELNAFFGGTHVQSYPEEPTLYSTHRFEAVTGDQRIRFEFLPGEDQLHLLQRALGLHENARVNDAL